MSEYTSTQAALDILRWLAAEEGDAPEVAAIIEKTHDPEIVICSAIRLPNGKIFRGHRHGDCIQTASYFVDYRNKCEDPDYPEPWNCSMCIDQGFITSKNRYVGREEGLQLQLKAGITSASEDGYRKSQLFSEDLY